MRTRAGSFVAALFLLVVLAAPAAAADSTWVVIGGPQDRQPDPGFTLEIGSRAWTIDALNGGGGTNLDLGAPTIVRVRRLSDCAPVVRFVAQPGRMYFIRFAADGTARVEDWTARGMDSGPGLGDGGPATCPRLPDTSTNASAPAGSGMLVLAVVLGLSLAVTSFGLARRSPR